MPLVPCRACGHQVDTSALACPGCGATNPGRKISRQQRDILVSLVQLVIATVLLGWGGWYVWNTAIPMIKEILIRPQAEQTRSARRSPDFRIFPEKRIGPAQAPPSFEAAVSTARVPPGHATRTTVDAFSRTQLHLT